MHHEKRVVILIGILSGICISLGFIRPFDGVITLSELVLQLSGSRGELSMSCNLVELIGFMLRMMPNYIMILVFGNKLYGHFCTASIYVFSRCPNRMKWYGKEMLQLINFICIFELVFLSTTAIASVLRYQVIFSVGGFILLGCHALIFMLWNFTLVLLVNLLAINIGSSAAFTLVMVVQMTCTAALSIINILTKMQMKQDIIYVFLWLNPVAHTVLGWHRSTLLEVELANSRYSLNLVTSILIPALFCIVTVLMGGQLIQKKDLLAEDMEMETGNIYGFWGRNGSGKTMLFRALSGLMKIDSGNIYWNDKELHKDFAVLPSQGIVLEHAGLYPNKTGVENLLYLAQLKGVIGKREVEEAIQRVGLDPADKRVFGKYSMGMKQRLVIAQAIMEKPDVIMLDEPTNGLDEAGIKEIRQLIEQEKERGALILLASHNQEDMKILADQVYKIADGRIERKGTEL